MEKEYKTNCIYCYSSNVIKHGTTATGKHRLRCRSCNKTWIIEKNDFVRPDFCQIVEKYLEGNTCRELVSLYHSSPLRINQKIRNYLQYLPSWEEYLDLSAKNHFRRIIFLLGKKFACNCNQSNSNSMLLAVAIDAVSSVVLGFEIGVDGEYNIWTKLLNRMRKRKILAPSFLTNGSKIIEDAINLIYPKSTIRIFFNRFLQDTEQDSLNNYVKINDKFYKNAINSYKFIKKPNFNNFFSKFSERFIYFLKMAYLIY
jgi:transposase-like protein